MPHIGNFPAPGYPKPLIIGPAEFAPKEEAVDFVREPGYLKSGGALTTLYFYAQVLLPDKATMDKLTLYGNKDDVMAELRVELFRVDHSTAAVQKAIVTADWITGHSSGFDDTIEDPVIDNLNYTYVLRLLLNPNDAPGDVFLDLARIDWH